MQKKPYRRSLYIYQYRSLSSFMQVLSVRKFIDDIALFHFQCITTVKLVLTDTSFRQSPGWNRQFVMPPTKVTLFYTDCSAVTCCWSGTANSHLKCIIDSKLGCGISDHFLQHLSTTFDPSLFKSYTSQHTCTVWYENKINTKKRHNVVTVVFLCGKRSH